MLAAAAVRQRLPAACHQLILQTSRGSLRLVHAPSVVVSARCAVHPRLSERAAHTSAAAAANQPLQPAASAAASSPSSTHAASPSAGDATTPAARRPRPTAITSFEHLTPRTLQKRVRQLGFQTPSPIQAASFRAIQEGRSVIIGAETGSGKSLAYLLPILSRLLTTPRADDARRYPRVILLQPNRELIAQLESVLTSLVGPSGQQLYWASLTGTQTFPIRTSPMIDLLITTPACLSLNVNNVDLARARSKRRSAPHSSFGGRFDLVAFVDATETVVMDEVDFLLDGDMAQQTKGWIDEWYAGRMKRRRNEQQQPLRPADSRPSTEQVSSFPDPQFIFCGATLANISPLASFQYLLDQFTPFRDRPNTRGPRQLDEHAIPASCQLELILTPGFHHLSPQLLDERVGTLWKKVGPSERAVVQIDDERLLQLERAAEERQNLSRVDRQTTDDEEILREEQSAEDGMDDPNSPPSLATLADRARESQGKGRLAGAQKDRYFKSKLHGARYDPVQAREARREREESDLEDRHAELENETDQEKLALAVDWINQRTPEALAEGQPPRKSLMFVRSVKRLQALLAVLHSSAASSSAKGSPRLSPHVQLIPYHAQLKAQERVEAMGRFNSAEPATTYAAGDSKHPSPSVTHHILVCTSIVARGLDFNQIVVPPAELSSSSAKPSLVRPGFTSLIQFDMSQNAVEYIHRVGRLFRMRPQRRTAGEREEEGQDAELASTTSSQQQHPSPPDGSSSSGELPRVLNLYTAVDELLVSHIRVAGSNPLPVSSDAADAATASSSTDAAGSTAAATSSSSSAGLIPDAAFSRNRRLRHVAKRREKRAREAEQQA